MPILLPIDSVIGTGSNWARIMVSNSATTVEHPTNGRRTIGSELKYSIYWHYLALATVFTIGFVRHHVLIVKNLYSGISKSFLTKPRYTPPELCVKAMISLLEGRVSN